MEVSAMEEALPKATARRKGGLRTIPFIISNEIFEKVATFGLTANMILYLTERYLMSNALATEVLYFWGAISNFLPIFVVCAWAYGEEGQNRVVAAADEAEDDTEEHRAVII